MDCHCFSPALEVCSGPSFALASIDVVITVMMVLVLGEKLFSYYVHPSTVLSFSDRVRGVCLMVITMGQTIPGAQSMTKMR